MLTNTYLSVLSGKKEKKEEIERRNGEKERKKERKKKYKEQLVLSINGLYCRSYI